MREQIDWSRVEKQEGQVRRLLEKWRGHEAMICGARTSHRWLMFCVTSPAAHPRFLEIRCGDCEHVSGPFRWSDCSFELERLEPEDGLHSYILRDEPHHFTLHCGIVAAHEMSFHNLK